MMMKSVVMCFTLCVPPLCQYRKSSTPFFLLNECHIIVISFTVKESPALKDGSLLYSTKMKKGQRTNWRLFYHIFLMEEQVWLTSKLILGYLSPLSCDVVAVNCRVVLENCWTVFTGVGSDRVS